MRKKRACFLLLLILLLLGSCAKKEAPRYPYWECMNPETFDIMGISVFDYDGEWFVEKPSEREALIPIYDIPAEQQGYAVKLPEVYAKTQNGIRCEVRFFRSIHEYNDLIQVRVTVSNETGEDISYLDNIQKIRFENQTDNTTISNIHYRPYDCEVHIDVPVYVTVAAGESISFEYIYPCNPELLSPDDDVVVQFSLKTDPHTVSFTIPVEIVRVGS